MSDEGHGTIDLNAASKPQLQRALIAVAEERDTLERQLTLHKRALAALVCKYDLAIIFGPDKLLVRGSLDLPPATALPLPTYVTVELADVPGGGGRVLVQRIEPSAAAPQNGDVTAKAVLLP